MNSDEAFRDQRDADDHLHWLEKRAFQPREIPFCNQWTYTISFDLHVPEGEEPPPLREAIRRAMAKERE